MASSIISFRIDDGLREKVRSWSALEHRTISNFIEALLHRESELRDGDVVTLESLDVKLERLLGLQAAQTKPVKVKKVAPPPAVEDEQELPDYLDKEVWADWCAHRASIKKPLSASSIKYSIREMEKAHANGWDVNALIIDAMAKQWTGFVFDKHRDCRADGKEIIVAKVSKEEIEECVNALLKMDCLYVASLDVWRKLLETAFENSQWISANDVANICKVLRKINGNKYTVESDNRLNTAIQSKSVLDDDGNLTLFTREELTKSGL